MRVRQHRLVHDDGKALNYRPSPNHSGTSTPEYLVVHFTRGASAESSINWLTDRRARASAHLVIARDGTVTQLVPFNRKAWHAGRSRWADRERLNSWSIGIELDNHGDLIGGSGRWRTAWGRPVDDQDVVELPHKHDGKVRGWHDYSEQQLQVTAAVATALIGHYGLKDVVGHDDIAPGRKLDPGPAFPMESFRAAVLGRETDVPEVYQTTAALNIRSGPGTRHDKLPASPLPPGTRLDVLSSHGLWRKVDVLDTVGGEMDVVGWVHSRYIRLAS